jgi:hypothetical protein
MHASYKVLRIRITFSVASWWKNPLGKYQFPLLAAVPRLLYFDTVGLGFICRKIFTARRFRFYPHCTAWVVLFARFGGSVILYSAMESCPSEVTLGTYVTQETRTNNEDIL